MPVTRKIGSAPLRLPSEVGEIAASLIATSTAKARISDAPTIEHERIHRSAPTRGPAPGRVLFDLRTSVKR